MSHEFESELTGSRAEIAAVLDGVGDGLLAGSIRLGAGPDAVTLSAPDEIDLEIEVETEDDEVSLELELEWERSDSDEAVVSPAAERSAESDDSTAETEDLAAKTDDLTAESDDLPAETDALTSETNNLAAETDDLTTESDGLPTETDDLTAEIDDLAAHVGAASTSQSLARFEVFRDRADEWRWRLRHRNGNIIASSGEGYTRKHNAWKGLRSVMKNAPEADLIEEAGTE